MTSIPPVPDALVPLLTSGLPQQRAFAFSRPSWSRWFVRMPGVLDAMDALPDRVDRAHVATTVDGLIDSDVAAAFVVAMIWGHGKSGYGPFRTARILTGGRRRPLEHELSTDVVDKLRASVDHVRGDGPVEGYRYMANEGALWGLGPAFFTKWLCFASARGDHESDTAAPILDAIVIRWLHRNSDVRLRTGRTVDYEWYVDTLRAWGSAAGLSAVQVEERIFRLNRADGAVAVN
ncbi:8-oxoguanine DNA glycosylase OGG fold protein [Rhodococcoides corynebacterioides]|uniref:8-oxoguanine DNA glycosylase OGG fold protein n=1 Tax=Rhodococcoides corynebacterioides TaxID=53972 RepID=UPI001114BAAB|nr:hypothetical protein [Rhodococcus corynebacterioides]